MKIYLYFLIFLCTPFTSRADLSVEEKNFIVGRALSFAYSLDAASDICSGSTNSRDKFDALKNIVQSKLNIDLYKAENDVNAHFGRNVRDNLKIGLRGYISELGGCDSGKYYEWLVKAQKDYGEALVVIMAIE